MQHDAQPTSFIARLFGGAPAPRRVTRWSAAQVRQGTTREFPCGGRMTVHCRDGEAWITHDGDPRDVVLQAPQSYTADRSGRMTLHALKGNCVVEFEEEVER
ncbi:DUF2917 domain-containing protein [Ramlibacter alkalitolerans]|uniref:DUF2917 domain-containing protein n=1 Tax=Ramlibacter alkalitolerans TaxID=2039631 RepID=A0ABS1JW62_9BURK|nr:DUF2917 domain-containing protein [Ramlibacter alkalitolerans]MBL0428554.1 DUF2917 domain-containing protein [Ramlibacter alkalitolerans]